MWKVMWFGMVVGLAALWAVWWTVFGPAPGSPIALRPENPEIVAQGREVYHDACAVCHGAELQGQPNWRTRAPDGTLPAPPHDSTGHTWHHPDEVLFALTKYGPGAAAGNPAYQSNMPAYSEILSDAEIIAVLSYIKAQWPPEIRARHDDINILAGAN